MAALRRATARLVAAAEAAAIPPNADTSAATRDPIRTPTIAVRRLHRVTTITIVDRTTIRTTAVVRRRPTLRAPRKGEPLLRIADM
jgi:hypothetical protein